MSNVNIRPKSLRLFNKTLCVVFLRVLFSLFFLFIFQLQHTNSDRLKHIAWKTSLVIFRLYHSMRRCDSEWKKKFPCDSHELPWPFELLERERGSYKFGLSFTKLTEPISRCWFSKSHTKIKSDVRINWAPTPRPTTQNVNNLVNWLDFRIEVANRISMQNRIGKEEDDYDDVDLSSTAPTLEMWTKEFVKLHVVTKSAADVLAAVGVDAWWPSKRVLRILPFCAGESVQPPNV